MNISKDFYYRQQNNKIILTKKNTQYIYLLNETGQIIFNAMRKEDSLKNCYDLVLRYFMKLGEEKNKITEIFNQVQKNLYKIGIFEENGIGKNISKGDKKLEQKNTHLIRELYKDAYENEVPLDVQIEIERMCNYNCYYCYLNGSKNISQSHKLSIVQIQALFDNLHDLGTKSIIISGGEPFLREDLCDLLELSTNYGFEISIFTNGSLIDDRHIEVLKKIRLHSLRISFYGTEGDYDRITKRKGYFKTVMNVLEKLTNNNIEFYLAFPITRLNTSSFSFIKELEKKYLVAYNYKIENSYSGKNVNVAEDVNLPYNDSFIKNNVKKTIKKIKYSDGTTCGGGITKAAIDVKGNVYPCYDYIYPVGNVKTTNFSDIWHNSPDLKKFRSIVKSNIKSKFCSSCKYEEFCVYCIAKNMVFNGSFDKFTIKQCESAIRDYNIYNLL